MKLAKLVLTATIVLCLTLVVTAQLPQKARHKPVLQQDQDRIEAAHSELLNAKDKAAEASKLTAAVLQRCRSRRSVGADTPQEFHR